MSNEGRSNFGYVGDDNSKADYKRNEPEAATTSTSAESRRSLKISVLKNVVLISISFMLLFTSYQSMAALQSSINKVSSKADKGKAFDGTHDFKRKKALKETSKTNLKFWNFPRLFSGLRPRNVLVVSDLCSAHRVLNVRSIMGDWEVGFEMGHGL